MIVALLMLAALAVQGTDSPKVPYRIEVSFNKTTHILFPADVRYVDLGSTVLVAGKADGAQNVVRIKAAVRSFEGESNFTVITSDGTLYTFTAVYADDPALVTVEIEDWLHKDPFSDFATGQQYVRLNELCGQTPLLVNQTMYTICKLNRSLIKTIGSRRYGMQLLLKGIYIEGDLLYFHTELRNLSRIPFDVDRVRFRIADRRVARRTAVQETAIEPVRVFSQAVSVAPGERLANVYVFGKFTIPDDKVLIMDVFEKNGGRHQSFQVGHADLTDARGVGALKIE